MFWKSHGIEKKDLLVPGSVLIAAILISVSVLVSAGKISWDRSGGGSNPQAAQEEGGEFEVAKRKDAPTIGTGKVELIVFSDFQCPFCQQFYNGAYKEIKAKYIDTGKVKITFRHFPLPFHQNAQKAGEAAECANRQGKFWPYHDILFEKMQADGTGLDIASLKQYAQNLGLNIVKFNACLDGGETAEIVKKDLKDGQDATVSGTPTIFVDGKKVVGAQPFESFKQEIEAALK